MRGPQLKKEIDSLDLERGYREADRELRIRHAKVWCVLALVLMPAGVILDYFVYPHLIGSIFGIRLLCDVGVAAVFALLYTGFGKRHVQILGIIWALLPGLAMAWMIYYSEGATSPYYAGLNLVMITVCLLMPWTVKEVFITCLLMVGLYLMACLLHSHTPVSWSILINNLYFLLLTGIICVTVSVYTAHRRFEEFRLRWELDLRNRQIAESFKKLEEIDRLKSEFFANVSHELRTPLTLILAPIQDIFRQKDNLPVPLQEALSLARQNALRLLKLINDLLEIIRLEAGRAELKLKPVNLALFIPGLTDSIRRLAQAKAITLKTEGETEDLVVQGDPDRLEKVILNLLTNALKFTPSGGSITTRWFQEDGKAVVEVQDTGIGIQEKDLPHIFERFHRCDVPSPHKFQGLGIGLALVKALVEEHGGQLGVESRPGEGTTLRIRLPMGSLSIRDEDFPRGNRGDEDVLDEANREADRTVPGDALDQLEDPPETGSGEFTILVIDDEPDMRRYLVSTLAAEYRVLQAADGETGLTIARKVHPDLVLLDMMLPGMDGLAVCEAIKGNGSTRNIKVVLLTARVDEPMKISALERGADDFLTKPFSGTELLVRLKNLIEAARLEEDLRERNVALEEALRQLKETEANLVQSEKMNALGGLAAGLLHEINNPLNFTLTALQLARQGIGDSNTEILEMLDDIDEGMTRIRDLVSDLRSFARPPQEGDRQAFRIFEPIQSALHLAAHELAGLHVTQTLPEDTRMMGSKAQITHLFLNLLLNAAWAVRHIPSDRPPEIRVSASPVNGRIQVRIRDNGVGIRECDLPKVFEPFFTAREVGEGMGLGLSICHTIVKNHGGTLSLASQEGQWTEVTFELPLNPKEV